MELGSKLTHVRHLSFARMSLYVFSGQAWQVAFPSLSSYPGSQTGIIDHIYLLDIYHCVSLCVKMLPIVVAIMKGQRSRCCYADHETNWLRLLNLCFYPRISWNKKLIVDNFGLKSLNKSLSSGVFKVPWLIAFHFYGNVNPELIEIDSCDDVLSKLRLQVLSFLSGFIDSEKGVYIFLKIIFFSLTYGKVVHPLCLLQQCFSCGRTWYNFRNQMFPLCNLCYKVCTSHPVRPPYQSYTLKVNFKCWEIIFKKTRTSLQRMIMNHRFTLSTLNW